jgi:hypothetical protein
LSQFFPELGKRIAAMPGNPPDGQAAAERAVLAQSVRNSAKNLRKNSFSYCHFGRGKRKIGRTKSLFRASYNN